jgi:hypothetical protein
MLMSPPPTLSYIFLYFFFLSSNIAIAIAITIACGLLKSTIDYSMPTLKTHLAKIWQYLFPQGRDFQETEKLNTHCPLSPQMLQTIVH